MFKNFKWKIALLIPIGILLTDQTGAIIKRMELRSRPWTVHTDINHLGGKGGKLYSFPSNHAANSTFLAIAFSVFYPKLKWFFLLSAGYIFLFGSFLVGNLTGIKLIIFLIFVGKKN